MIYKASAPGRLDVMGGISDYSGALVLQMPLKETTEVTVKGSGGSKIEIQSVYEGGHSLGKFSIEVAEFLDLCKNPAAFREKIRSLENGNWAIYPAACLAVLVTEKGLQIESGLGIEITSTVPLGKGVSSSAAIEVATIRSLSQWQNHLHFNGTELAILAQKAENLFVGAPCGLMDQLASSFGVQGGLLPILCQPDVLYPILEIPEDIHFYGIDSGIKHQVVGASYADVRTATSMGYAILALEAGATLEDLSYARQTGDKSRLPFGGYLANLNLSEFVHKRAHLLPETITGAEFLSFYKETADPYAVINPSATYAVRICTRHPIEENLRTRQFRLLLSSFSTVGQDKKEEALLVLGELMFGSHASYSLCGLGHPQTDQIVEMVRENLGQGVFGAKITGGGSGGTVCVLSVGEEGKETVNKIHGAYQEKLGRNVLLIKTK